jgi:signal transduction histidine kinase
LSEVIADCALELKPLYDERRITLVTEGVFPSIQADETMLRQALLNLLRNAAEAIDEEQAVRRVTVRGARLHDASDEEWANIEISDTGSGLAEADLQRIFIPFFTTKSKGHGVGLALAHRVITDHGGTLSAANVPEGGAVFNIRLPL